jgi:rhamnose utilization protein RhaD (predicted bifunctional aldolase and dehydrogenase)
MPQKMSFQKATNILVKISKYAGESLAYIQGGGGNTSVKISSSEMLVKSSGVNLKDLTKNSGYCKVDHKKINNFINSSQKNTSFEKAIEESKIDGNGRPSMETGFHSQLGNYVLHSHPVYINTFLCSTESQIKLKALIPEAHWIKYATPGEAVTYELKKVIDKKKLDPYKDDLVFLLENHGVIISTNNHLDITKIHEDINNRIRKAYSFKKFEPFKILDNVYDLPTLFPDQIVYINKDPQLKSPGSKETFASASYILNNMKSLGLVPKELSPKEKNLILNLDSEKYRQNIINNGTN